MTKVTLFLGSMAWLSGICGQPSDPHSYPEVGQPMPDLTIRNIQYFPKKEASLREFRGKWLLLDFWDVHCGACVASFPVTNDIQTKLGDKVQVMLVGVQDEENKIQPLYAKFREKHHLVMPCAFDSMLTNRLDIGAVPHLVLIDDKGVVQCITSIMNAADIQGFLDGKPPVLPRSYRRAHDDNPEMADGPAKYDFQKPFLVYGNGGRDTDYLFRSVLSAWSREKNEQFISNGGISDGPDKGVFQVLGAPLEWLFNYAYLGTYEVENSDTARYGKYCDKPILKIQDPSRFKFSFKTSSNLFSYSLTVPPSSATKELMEKAMQRDLETYFGYSAALEDQKCTYWKLVAKKDAKEGIHSKGGPGRMEGSAAAGYNVQNYPFVELIKWLRLYNNGKIFLDETGIAPKERVDLNLDCIPSDLEEVAKSLQAYGLDLVKTEKFMKVVVIRDKN